MLVGGPKFFVRPRPAGRVTVMQRNRVPEEFRRRSVCLVSGVDVARQIANKLWHLGVTVQACQDVFVSRQWITHRLMIEMMGKIQPTLVTSVGVEVGEDLWHAAKLSVEHLLGLRFIKLRENGLGPGGKLSLDFQCCSIAGVAISVAQTCKSLVQRVPRRPHAVEIEEAGSYIAAGDFRPLLSATF